ncbi:hypothetical protein ACFQU3_03820 [Terrabacter sp. GCM10028922]|uniref:HAAS signaling domain-containing protein n=1 Tax=Terrabacter sp. GCM10028922 TaxID=3273428 RepID=UPI00361578DD
MNQTHPLVDAYLDRLEHLLQGADSATRSEVLAGVREHLRSTAAADADDARVRQAITELGSPEQIADEAHVGGTGRSGIGPGTPRVTERPWLPILVMVLSLGWLVPLALLPLAGVVDAAAALHPSELIFFFIVAFPVWPAVALLVAASRLWPLREKVALAVALPATAVWLVAVSLVPVAFVHAAGMLVGVLAAATTIIVVSRRGLRRARQAR